MKITLQKEKQNNNAYHWIILFILIVSVIIRLKNIDKPLLDMHYFRQTQTATMVRNFHRGGINLFDTKLDILGTGKEQSLLLEFPFYQAITALISFIFQFSDSLGKIVSIFFGILSGLMLYMVIKIFTGNRLWSLISMVFFSFSPLNIFFQQAFMIESTVVFLHLASLCAWLIFLKRKNFLWLALVILTSTLAYLQKIVYVPVLFPLILTIVIAKAWKNKMIRNKAIIGLVIPIIFLILWQKHVDYSNSLHGNYFFTSTNAGQWNCNFSTLSDRINFRSWGFRTKLILDSVTKFQFFFFLTGVILLLQNSKRYYLFLVWILSCFLYTLIFFGVISQNYYLMPLLPMIASISGFGLYRIYLYFIRTINIKIINSFFLALLITYCVISIRNVEPFFSLDKDLYNNLISAKSLMNEKGNAIILLSQWDWNSVYTYYLDTKGITIGLNDLSKMDKYVKEGYKYLVMIDPDRISGDNIIKAYIKKSTNIYKTQRLAVYKLNT